MKNSVIMDKEDIIRTFRGILKFQCKNYFLDYIQTYIHIITKNINNKCTN